jgi:hypothetical protein
MGDQAFGNARFVVDCGVNPAAAAGHVRMTFAPEGMMVSCGGGNDERLNTVPEPKLPPRSVAP